MVNHNFHFFIESLIYPFWTLAEVTYLDSLFFVSFNISALQQTKEIYITPIFWMVNHHQNSPIKQFFSYFLKDNKYVLMLA